MVFPEERLLKRVASAEVGAMLHDMYTAHGVRIHTGVVPERFEGDGRVERVVLADGTVLPTDLVVMGVGIVLNTELAREAGLEMTDHGAVLVDRYLRTSDADIYAAGISPRGRIVHSTRSCAWSTGMWPGGMGCVPAVIWPAMRDDMSRCLTFSRICSI